MRLIPESYEIFLDDLHKDLSRLKKICVVLFPFGILIGAINIILYSMRIGHVPQGLSIADGVMFITVAAIFGAVFCAISLSFLGFVFIITEVRTWVIFDKNSIWRCLGVLVSTLIVFICLCFAIIGFYNYYGYLPFIIIFVFIVIERFLYKSKTKGRLNIKNKTYTNKIYLIEISYFIWVFVSILFFCVYILKIDIDSMRLANIRAENVTIYVKKPYSYLLRTKELTKIKVNSNKSAKDEGMSLYGFEKFDKATVLLRGFGGITMVSVGGNKLEIPNDYIIIPIKDKTQNLHR